MESILSSFRRVIKQNRQLNGDYQNCIKLICSISETIAALEKKIQELKAENEKHQSNASNNDEKSLDSKASPKQSTLLSLSKYVFWTIFVSHTLIFLTSN